MREEIIKNLRGKLTDSDFNTIEENYPLAPICPTCDGRKKYTLDFEVYECDCEVQSLLQRHYFAANIGREYHDIGFENFSGPDKEKILSVCSDYLDQFENNFHYGIGITLSGGVGTGKSFAAASILKTLVQRGHKVYFVTFEELIDVWGSSWYDNTSKKKLQDKLKRAEVLAIDEVRTDPRNSNGFLSNGFDSVIRYRTSNLLPTLITTNMQKEEELSEFFKVYSLLSAKNLRVETNGYDQRMREIRQRTLELAERGERRPVC